MWIKKKDITAYGILGYSVVLGLLPARHRSRPSASQDLGKRAGSGEAGGNDGRVGDAHLCTIEILGSYIYFRQIEVNSSI